MIEQPPTGAQHQLLLAIHAGKVISRYHYKLGWQTWDNEKRVTRNANFVKQRGWAEPIAQGAHGSDISWRLTEAGKAWL